MSLMFGEKKRDYVVYCVRKQFSTMIFCEINYESVDIYRLKSKSQCTLWSNYFRIVYSPSYKRSYHVKFSCNSHSCFCGIDGIANFGFVPPKITTRKVSPCTEYLYISRIK